MMSAQLMITFGSVVAFILATILVIVVVMKDERTRLGNVLFRIGCAGIFMAPAVGMASLALYFLTGLIVDANTETKEVSRRRVELISIYDGEEKYLYPGKDDSYLCYYIDEGDLCTVDLPKESTEISNGADDEHFLEIIQERETAYYSKCVVLWDVRARRKQRYEVCVPAGTEKG